MLMPLVKAARRTGIGMIFLCLFFPLYSGFLWTFINEKKVFKPAKDYFIEKGDKYSCPTSKLYYF
jgi:hypothetical protein